MKAYYSDYIAHSVRLYTKVSGDSGVVATLTGASAENYKACETVISNLDAGLKNIILTIYSSGNVNDSINRLSTETGVPTTQLWNRIKAFEKDVARERGLI